MKEQFSRRVGWWLSTGSLLLLFVALLSACQPIQPQATTGRTDPVTATTIPEVTIEVNDTAFTIPTDFPGGIVRVTVKNSGSKDLDISFARVREGSSIDEIMKLNKDTMSNLVPLSQMLGFMISYSPLAAGASQQAIIDFKTGQFIADATAHVDGAPEANAQHFYSVFTAKKLVGTVEPQTDVKVEMNDFAYTMPDEVKAGKQVWEYHNIGKQWHMQFFVKPAEGATMDEVLAALTVEGKPAGPPPFEIMFAGGIPPISEGERTWVEFTLEPGAYLVGCPLPDMATMLTGGQPKSHLAQGMHRLLTVTQ